MLTNTRVFGKVAREWSLSAVCCRDILCGCHGANWTVEVTQFRVVLWKILLLAKDLERLDDSAATKTF